MYSAQLLFKRSPFSHTHKRLALPCVPESPNRHLSLSLSLSLSLIVIEKKGNCPEGETEERGAQVENNSSVSQQQQPQQVKSQGTFKLKGRPWDVRKETREREGSEIIIFIYFFFSSFLSFS